MESFKTSIKKIRGSKIKGTFEDEKKNITFKYL